MKNDLKTFTLIDKNGRETEYEILFTFDCAKTGNSYIAYTDNSVDEVGNVQVYASIYDQNSAEISLMPIETDKEWKIIEIVLEEIQASLKNKDD